MRTLIAAMQVTLDGRILGPDGEVDWVDSWADGLELLPPVDAFVLGGGMFPEYERFWAAVLEDPAAVADMLGRDPYPREISYAQVAAETPHLVVSTTLEEVTWPTARIVRNLDEIRVLRQQPGKAVYVVGGPGLVAALLDAHLLDELRLIVHPVLVGGGSPFLDGITERHDLGLVAAEPMASGRVCLTYRVAELTRLRRRAGGGVNEFNRRIIEEFRAKGGRVGGALAGTPILLLHHIGARSGIERVTPLAWSRHDDGRYVIVASNGGSATHPGWYHNLKAHPTVEVEIGAETLIVQAEELEGGARDAQWSRLVAAAPSLTEYQAKAGRRIPMFALRPRRVR